MESMRLLISVVITASLAAISCSDNVPVVIWSNIRNKNCTPDLPLYPNEYILKLTESKYLDCIQKRNPEHVKIFVLNELDVSDFAVERSPSHSKAFHHFEKLLKESSSVEMPAVQATSLLPYLSASLEKSFENAEISVKELPEILRGDSTELRESISRIDDMIYQEIKKIPGEYFAVLTAEGSPQKRVPRDSDRMTVGRQLLATNEATNNKTTFINGTCVYITYTNSTLYYGDKATNLTNPSVTSVDCKDANTSESVRSITLQFQAKNSENKDETVTLELLFTSHKYPVSMVTWWNISSASLTHKLENSTAQTYKLRNTESYAAPRGWSWVCEAPELMTWRETKDKPITQKLMFENMQIQPFNISNFGFSRPHDCSGFLTGPIWMGTLISLLLAIIFAFGLAMTANLTTMDRFDDPRGKSIIVQGHEAGN